MIRVESKPSFWREVRRAPKEVGAWAKECVDAAEAPDATLSQITEGAFPLKGGNFL